MLSTGDRVTPAQLSSLAIYNPELGPTDETFRDQIVFYYTKPAKDRKPKPGDAENDRDKQEEEHHKLRQIGLAQGMVKFAGSFSDGKAVDSVETDKSRMVMHELEKSWWIVASIDLTRLPLSTSTASTSSSKAGDSNSSTSQSAVEYSSREVSPPALLISQLVQAHAIFALHHGPSLKQLLTRLGRDKFCAVLSAFWTKFAINWDVLLHGNPAVDIFGGVKLAAGGELGIGVGEEEWGSGEREVLEHYAGNTEGLVDMVVSRFGEPSKEQLDSRSNAKKGPAKAKMDEEMRPWVGSGTHAGSSDGVVFSGNGALSRSSLRDVSQWMQWIFSYGEYAYGVRDNPGSDRRKRRRKGPLPAISLKISPPTSEVGIGGTSASKANGSTSPKDFAPSSGSGNFPGIPPPIITVTGRRSPKPLTAADSSASQRTDATQTQAAGAASDTDTWTKYLTLGYGSTWGKSAKRPSQREPSPDGQSKNSQGKQTQSDGLRHIDPAPVAEPPDPRERIRSLKQRENAGHFIIGLTGNLESAEPENDEEEDVESGSALHSANESNRRTLVRTLHVQLQGGRYDGAERMTTDPSFSSGDESAVTSQEDLPGHRRLRVIVYVHRPFLYTFLFKPQTDAIQLSSFYQSLHSYLSPLHGPLCTSTSPTRVAARIASASLPHSTVPTNQSNPAPIFDLVYDPITLTVHASVPNIPDPGTPAAEGFSLPTDAPGSPRWTRVDALNVHSQILAMRTATAASGRAVSNELERTVKTARGWWVVWMRLPASASAAAEPAAKGVGDNSDTRSSAQSVGSSAPAVSESARSNSSTEGDDDDDDDDGAEESAGTVHAAQPEEKLQFGTPQFREAFLVRRARDGATSGRQPGAGGAEGMLGAASGWVGSGLFGLGERAGTGWAPVRLAEGIGIDARRYVEGLLSLNR